MANRRTFLQKAVQLCAGSFAAGAVATSSSETQPQTPSKQLRIMMKSAWGSDDPTRGSFVFSHGLALAEAGHEVKIFLTGEGTYLMRKAIVEAIKPIGWPPLSETMGKIAAKRIPIFA